MNKLFRNILILSGLLNILGALIFTKFFTHPIIVEQHPEVMSFFGMFMLMIWGILMLVMAFNYTSAPNILLVLALEKFIYVIVWVNWILGNSLEEVFQKDVLSGIFYSIYGPNDLIFLLVFLFIYRKTVVGNLK
jgi:hypothetical protein